MNKRVGYSSEILQKTIKGSPPNSWVRLCYTARSTGMKDKIRGSQPRNAASIAEMSIFFMVIIASKARLAAARSELVTA